MALRLVLKKDLDLNALVSATLLVGLERNTEREGNLSNIPKGNFVSAEVKLEK